MRISFLWVLVFLHLAACGGGSGTPDTAILQDFDDQYDVIFQRAFGPERDLPTVSPPAGGTAAYSGVFAAYGGRFDSEGTGTAARVFLGVADLTIEFAEGEISGIAANFLSVSNPAEWLRDNIEPEFGGAVDGELTLSGMLQDGDGASFDVRVFGKLDGPGTTSLNYNEQIGLPGRADLYGENAETLFVQGVASADFAGDAGFLGYNVAAELQ